MVKWQTHKNDTSPNVKTVFPSLLSKSPNLIEPQSDYKNSPIIVPKVLNINMFNQKMDKHCKPTEKNLRVSQLSKM